MPDDRTLISLSKHLLKRAYNCEFFLCPFEKYMHLLKLRSVSFKDLEIISLKYNHQKA